MNLVWTAEILRLRFYIYIKYVNELTILLFAIYLISNLVFQIKVVVKGKQNTKIRKKLC